MKSIELFDFFFFLVNLIITKASRTSEKQPGLQVFF